MEKAERERNLYYQYILRKTNFCFLYLVNSTVRHAFIIMHLALSLYHYHLRQKKKRKERFEKRKKEKAERRRPPISRQKNTRLNKPHINLGTIMKGRPTVILIALYYIIIVPGSKTDSFRSLCGSTTAPFK